MGREKIRLCYVEKLAPKWVDGTVAIRFVIAPDGSVSSADVQEDTFPTPAVAECVRSLVRGWRFPQPTGGGSVVVTYPFAFKAPTDGGIPPGAPRAE